MGSQWMYPSKTYLNTYSEPVSDVQIDIEFQ